LLIKDLKESDLFFEVSAGVFKLREPIYLQYCVSFVNRYNHWDIKFFKHNSDGTMLDVSYDSFINAARGPAVDFLLYRLNLFAGALGEDDE